MQVAPYKNESDQAATPHVCARMLSYSSVPRARSRPNGLNWIWRIKLELYRRAKVETRRVNLTLFDTSANRPPPSGRKALIYNMWTSAFI